MNTTWENVSFSWNGQDFPAGEVSVERRMVAAGETLAIARSSSSAYEVNVSASVPSASFDLTAFFRRRDGASDETLVRRARYGGRKGRSALRRLFKRSAPVQMAWGPVLMWGRCVVLDAGEMLFRTSVCRGHR